MKSPKNEKMSTLDTSLISILLGGISALGTAVGVLWKRVTVFHEETKSKLAECEEDREKLWKKIAHFDNGNGGGGNG